MSVSLVLTVIGPDEPGLVDRLSTVVLEHGGNWLESRMGRLAGRFAGILRVTVPEARTDALKAALQRLQGLEVVVEPSLPEPEGPCYDLYLELLGQDRPGIVQQITHRLAGWGVNIQELDSATLSGSMSGEALFQASLALRVPAPVTQDDLRGALEAIADELMVDIVLDSVPDD